MRMPGWWRKPMRSMVRSARWRAARAARLDRKSTRLNSSHVRISYAVFCLKKKTSCVPGGACSAAQVDSYDTVAPNQGIASHTFTMTKMTNIDLGAILAMAEGASKDAAMNQ